MQIIDSALSWLRKKACIQLHIPHCEVWLTLDFYDEYGNLTKHRKQRSKSWVKNAYTLACISMMDTIRNTSCGAGTTGVVATSGGCIGNEYNFWPLLPQGGQTVSTGHRNNLRGGTAETNRGIVVGRGVAAESFTDYALSTLIDQGYGTNQICYQCQDAYVLDYNAGTKTMKATHSRLMNNNSGANITLTETALYGRCYAASAYSYATFMVCRDVLSPSETYYDKAQLRVTYDISLVYPY